VENVTVLSGNQILYKTSLVINHRKSSVLMIYYGRHHGSPPIATIVEMVMYIYYSVRPYKARNANKQNTIHEIYKQCPIDETLNEFTTYVHV